MITDLVRHEINRFNPTLPLDSAWTPPASWYTQPEIYQTEIRTVFGRNWLIAARVDQVDEPRKYVCGQIAGERYVITRDDNNELHAFYNVCRHHAAAVATGEGSAKRLSCPYHGWTYGLDGKLVNAPELGEVKHFKQERFGLVPLAVDTWGPFVFISLGDDNRALNNGLAPLKAELDAMHFESLHFVGRRRYTIDCNWKVYIDNYLDGGYHVAYLHKGLAQQLDLSSYKTELFERFSIQSGAGAQVKAAEKAAGLDRAMGTDFAERIGSKVLYAWIYPNFMINRYGPIMDTNWVIPLSHDRCEVVFDYYFAEVEGDDRRQFIERSIAASDVVQQEDMDICTAVQRGLYSRSYDEGRYSAEREGAEHHFHRLLFEDLSSVLD